MPAKIEKVPKLRRFSHEKNFLKKLKKGVDKSEEMVYNNTCRHGVMLTKQSKRGRRKEMDGSLAQLGEHLPYKQRVTGSSPVAPTITVW